MNNDVTTKYEILENDTITVGGITLYRIKSLRDFADVEQGELGGYVQNENNLSQEGNAWVCGNARVYGNARVESSSDYIVVFPIGSEQGVFTAYKTETGIQCNRGCFYGTIDEFAERVKQTHGDNKYAKEYAVVIELVKMRLGSVVTEEAVK